MKRFTLEYNKFLKELEVIKASEFYYRFLLNF